MPSLNRKAVFLLLVYATGFGTCWILKEADSGEAKSNPTTLISAKTSRNSSSGHLEKSKQFPASTLLSDSPQHGADTKTGINPQRPLRVPAILTDVILPAILSGGDSELSTLSLMPYGLPSEDAADLRDYLNQKAQEIANLESNNSELLTTKSGDQYIRIKAFTEQGLAVKKEIEDKIDGYFANYEDDRGDVLKQQLFRTILYQDFGITDKEISIDNNFAPDGSPGHVFTISRYNGTEHVGTYSNAMLLPLMEGRFGRILEKHRSKISP